MKAKNKQVVIDNKHNQYEVNYCELTQEVEITNVEGVSIVLTIDNIQQINNLIKGE